MAEQVEVTEQVAPEDGERGVTLHAELVGFIVAAVLSRISKETVTAIVDATIREHMGGRRVYVPMTSAKLLGEVRARDQSQIRTRDEAVRRAFNGSNMAEVCKAFGLSRASFYRAINPKARKAAKKRQHQAGGPRRG